MQPTTEFSLAELNQSVRRHAHDLRNCINYIELETTLLLESLADPETLSQLQMMKRELAVVTDLLRSLSARVSPLKLEPTPLMEIFTKWRKQLHLPPTGPQIVWDTTQLGVFILTDTHLLVALLGELLTALRQATGAQEIRISLVPTPTDIAIELTASPTAALREDPTLIHEWTTLAARSGGHFSRTNDPSSMTGFRISFPVAPLDEEE